MTKILYLEDEHFLGRIVKESLASRGYKINLVTNGAQLMDNFHTFEPDICVLDVMVPNIDGFTLGKKIHEINPELPIIFLSAKNQTEDILEGFKSGGNDYIKKPFSMEELIVRIENLLSIRNPRTTNSLGETISIGKFKFYPKKYLLQINSENIKLSHRDNEILLLFSKHVNQKIDRRMILTKIWGDDSVSNSRNLDVYIRKLRVYFEADPKIKLITLRSFGYYWGIDK